MNQVQSSICFLCAPLLCQCQEVKNSSVKTSHDPLFRAVHSEQMKQQARGKRIGKKAVKKNVRSTEYELAGEGRRIEIENTLKITTDENKNTMHSL